MCDGGNPRVRAVDEGSRAPDVADRPQYHREAMHRGDAFVMSEAESKIVVAPGLKQRQRLFKMLPRFAVLSGEPMRHPGCAVSDSGLGRVRPRLDVAEEGLGVGPHRRQLAAHVAAGPQAVVSRQPLKRVLVASGEFASLCEGLGCLGRAITARRD
jgi:hypothetical protein